MSAVVVDHHPGPWVSEFCFFIYFTKLELRISYYWPSGQADSMFEFMVVILGPLHAYEPRRWVLTRVMGRRTEAWTIFKLRILAVGLIGNQLTWKCWGQFRPAG